MVFNADISRLNWTTVTTMSGSSQPRTFFVVLMWMVSGKSALFATVTRATKFSVSRTRDEMIVDHADCLHEGIADR